MKKNRRKYDNTSVKDLLVMTNERIDTTNERIDRHEDNDSGRFEKTNIKQSRMQRKQDFQTGGLAILLILAANGWLKFDSLISNAKAAVHVVTGQ